MSTPADQIIQLADGTRTYSEIGAAMGLTYYQVTSRVQYLRRRGAVVPVKQVAVRESDILDLADGTRTLPEIARLLGVKYPALYRRVQRMRAAGTPVRVRAKGKKKRDRRDPAKRAARLERDMLVLAAIERGDSLSEIAEAFELSREGVRRIGLRNDVDTVRVQGQR